MKTTTKVTIGLSVAAIAGISVAVLLSDKVIRKMNYAANRCRARKFVERKFHGNKKVMDIVDSLSDEDLQSVVDIAGKVKKGTDKVKDYGDSVKDSTSELKKKLLGYLEALG